MTRRVTLSTASIFVHFSLGCVMVMSHPTSTVRLVWALTRSHHLSRMRHPRRPHFAPRAASSAFAASPAGATPSVLSLTAASPPVVAPILQGGSTALQIADGCANDPSDRDASRCRKCAAILRVRSGRAIASSRPALGSICARARGRPPARAASFLPAPPRPRSLNPDALSSPTPPARPLRSTLGETARETAPRANVTPETQYGHFMIL